MWPSGRRSCYFARGKADGVMVERKGGRTHHTDTTHGQLPELLLGGGNGRTGVALDTDARLGGGPQVCGGDAAGCRSGRWKPTPPGSPADLLLTVFSGLGCLPTAPTPRCHTRSREANMASCQSAWSQCRCGRYREPFRSRSAFDAGQ